MQRINRRDFMKRTAGSIAATAVLADQTMAAPTTFSATAQRTLGKTGITCSTLGMGTGTKAWNGSSGQYRKGRKAFVSLLEHAYAEGITYFDMADMYGAHDYMKAALKNTVQREEVMLLSKTVSREPDLIKADLERFRHELDTDYIDVVLMHCLTEPGWTEPLKGCMDVLSEAKEKGIIRAHGVSCHNLGAMQTAAAASWVDIILARINPFEVKMDGTVEEVVSILHECRADGKGVLGMKIVGEGQLKDKMPESIEFVLKEQCIDAMTIGFLEEGEIGGAQGMIDAVPTA